MQAFYGCATRFVAPAGGNHFSERGFRERRRQVGRAGACATPAASEPVFIRKATPRRASAQTSLARDILIFTSSTASHCCDLRSRTNVTFRSRLN